MTFNPDPSKKRKKLFSLVRSKRLCTTIFFNNKPVQQVSSQNHLGLTLDTSLTCDELIRAIISKVSKSIGLLRKLSNRLLRSSLITI